MATKRDDTRDALTRLEDIADHIESLAHAFELTGNKGAADILDSQSFKIRDCCDTILGTLLEREGAFD